LADHNHGSVDPVRAPTRLHDDLSWDSSDPMRPVMIHRGEPVASFECLMPAERRVITRLEFLGGRRSVDVGVQPDTIVHLVRRLAMRRHNNSDAWLRAVRKQLLMGAAAWEIPTSIEPRDSLGEVIAVLGFPMVHMARARGVDPPPFIPRWAEPVLVAAEPRSAARAVFGQRASRRVARSLAASLVRGAGAPRVGGEADPQQGGPTPTMTLVPLAFAMALPPSAAPDLIANILEGPTAPHASQHWPSVDELEIIRRGFRLIGARSSVRLALDAMDRLDGPATLANLMVHLPRLLASQNRPCPQRLDPLAVAVEDFVNEPADLARQREPPAVPRVAAYQDNLRIDLPAEPRYPPGVLQPVAVGDGFEYPTSVRRLHGAAVGEHSLWLPRSARELRAWGEELSNCMADYCRPVAEHRSVILGLRRRDRLVAGVELTRDLRRVRQFVRDDNQRPWKAERDALREILGRLGVGGG